MTQEQAVEKLQATLNELNSGGFAVKIIPNYGFHIQPMTMPAPQTSSELPAPDAAPVEPEAKPETTSPFVKKSK